jgi:hypothetical protein
MQTGDPIMSITEPEYHSGTSLQGKKILFVSLLICKVAAKNKCCGENASVFQCWVYLKHCLKKRKEIRTFV